MGMILSIFLSVFRSFRGGNFHSCRVECLSGGPCDAGGFPLVQRARVRFLGCFSFGCLPFDLLVRLRGFGGVVSIHGVSNVFSKFQFRFRVSVVGAGRFSVRAGGGEGGEGRGARVSFGNVSFDFLQCVMGFQATRVSVGSAGGFSSGYVFFDFLQRV